MCLMMYLGSEILLPERDTAFLQVLTPHESELAVREYFDEPYVYFVGAHTGCSCGFPYEFGDPASDVRCHDPIGAGTYDISSAVALLELFDECLRGASVCTVICMPTGAESEPPTRELSWSRSDLEADTLMLQPGCRYRIKKGVPEESPPNLT